MATTFHLSQINTPLAAMEIERWLHANLGPSIKETLPKNIKVYSWQSRFLFGADWHSRTFVVDIENKTDAVAFKLRWYEQVTKTV